jgi:hypothetical protein
MNSQEWDMEITCSLINWNRILCQIFRKLLIKFVYNVHFVVVFLMNIQVNVQAVVNNGECMLEISDDFIIIHCN